MTLQDQLHTFYSLPDGQIVHGLAEFHYRHELKMATTLYLGEVWQGQYLHPSQLAEDTNIPALFTSKARAEAAWHTNRLRCIRPASTPVDTPVENDHVDEAPGVHSPGSNAGDRR